MEVFPSGLVRAPRSPPPPSSSARRPALGGLPGSGRFRCRVRGRSRPAFPPSIHQWETGEAGAPRLGRVVAAALGVVGGGGPGRSPSPARSRACGSRPLPPEGRAPTLGLQLACWALGRFTAAAGRAEPRLRGARVWAAAWRLPARGPGAPEPAWCGPPPTPRPTGHRGRGRGPGSGARLHPRGVWIAPVRGGHREARALQEAQPPRAGVQGS